MIASINGHAEVVEKLLLHGASVDVHKVCSGALHTCIVIYKIYIYIFYIYTMYIHVTADRVSGAP